MNENGNEKCYLLLVLIFGGCFHLSLVAFCCSSLLVLVFEIESVLSQKPKQANAFGCSFRLFVACYGFLGRRQANLCFHFAGSGENLPDITKSRDASMGKNQNNFLFRTASCHFPVEVFPQITNNLSAGDHCQRDIKEAPLYECQRISA